MAVSFARRRRGRPLARSIRLLRSTPRPFCPRLSRTRSRAALRARRLILALTWGIACAGCTSPTLRQGQEAFRHGNLEGAEELLGRFAKQSRDDENAVIAHLELGSVRRARGRPEASNEAFSTAEAEIERLDRKADLRISKAVEATLTNLSAVPYRGREVERIMMSAYRALNYLELGAPRQARVELRKAHHWQERAVERNAAEIEAARAAVEKRAEERAAHGQVAYDVERARSDPRFRRELSQAYAHLDRFEPYGSYVNPFAEWLQGLHYMAQPAEPADLERARKALERTRGMVGENRYVEADLALAEARKDGAPFPDVTYVVFATGNAPKLAETRIDIPLFVAGSPVDYVGAAFPRLVEDESYARYVRVEGGGVVRETATVADMDSLLSRELKDELPAIVAKTLFAAGTKAAIAYALNRATEDDDLLNIIVRVATTAYQYGVNRADLRIWASLPKQIQYARIPTPADGRIRLSAPGGSTATVSVTPHAANGVWVRSYEPGGALHVRRFDLEKGGDDANDDGAVAVGAARGDGVPHGQHDGARGSARRAGRGGGQADRDGRRARASGARARGS